jgi:hypothetical protein
VQACLSFSKSLCNHIGAIIEIQINKFTIAPYDVATKETDSGAT